MDSLGRRTRRGPAAEQSNALLPPLLPEHESLLLLPLEHESLPLLLPLEHELLPSLLLLPLEHEPLLSLLPSVPEDGSLEPLHAPLVLVLVLVVASVLVGSVPEQLQPALSSALSSASTMSPATAKPSLMTSPLPLPLDIIPPLEPAATPEAELDPEPDPVLVPPSPHPLVSRLVATSTELCAAPYAKPRNASTPLEPAGIRMLCRVTQVAEGVSPESASARSSAPGPQRRLPGSIWPDPGASTHAGVGATTPSAAWGQTAATGALDARRGVAVAMHWAESKAPSP